MTLIFFFNKDSHLCWYCYTPILQRTPQEVELWSHLLKASDIRGAKALQTSKPQTACHIWLILAEYHKSIDYIFESGMRDLFCEKHFTEAKLSKLVI